MSNQIVISSGAKVRNLEGVLTGTSGVVNSLGINVPDGIPQLDGSGKILVSQLPNSVMEYKGTWNASTNTPTLANGTGNAGDVYLCNVAGTVNFGAGPITFAVGDQVLYSGTTWERASGATGTVTSVSVTESGDALTITGSPITTSGTINIGFAGTTGQYINGAGGLTTFPSLTGFVPYTGATADVDLGAFDLKTSKLWLYDAPNDGFGSIHLSDGSMHFEDADGHTMFDIEDGFIQIHKDASIQSNLFVSDLTATRNHYLPNASGTLALTSDLSGYVTLATDQTITGAKTFSQDILVNSVKVGKGAGTGANNIAIGDNVLTDNTTGYANLAIGSYALWHNTVGFGNIALGRESLIAATTGSLNIAIGDNTMKGIVTGGQNIAIGANTAQNATSGSSNTLIGYSVGNSLTTGSNNIFIGLSSGSTVSTGNYNTIIGGFPSFSGSGSMSNNIILADGEGNIRYRWDGTQTLINGVALGSNAFTSTSYLPLSGGTLTGALSGTSATFSGNVIATKAILGASTATSSVANLEVFGSTQFSTNNGQIRINDSVTTSKTMSLGVDGTNNVGFIQSFQDGVAYRSLILNGLGGNVGIGTSSPFTQGSGGTSLELAGSVYGQFYVSANSASIRGVVMARASTLNDIYIASITNSPLAFGTNDAERMRITSGGSVCMGRTSAPSSAYRLAVQDAVMMAVSTNGNNMVNFFNQSDSYVASIVVNASSVAYNTSSDYRLKDDLKDFEGLSLLSNIKVYDFAWKLDKTRTYGVIAHELAEVLPNAVSGEKDGQNIQGVDYSKLVPILVKAIQELSQELNELKAKIK